MSDKPKYGEGHAEAMFRQGLSELRASMYPDSNIARGQVEYGIWGTLTPGEVAQDRRESVRDLNDDPNQSRSILNEKLQELQKQRDEPGMDPPGMEMDR